MSIAAGLSPGGEAVVTGASSGVGRAVAACLGRAGMRVLLVGRDVGRLDEAAQAIGDGARTLSCDLATQAGCEAAAACVPPGLDVLVHAAGLHQLGPLSETEASDLDRLLALNVRAPHQLTRFCLPALRAAAGQVVFVNSSQGIAASRNVGGYAATKHALKAVADAFRAEVNAEGVRVLSIYPGRTATPMQAAIYAAEKRDYRPEALMQPEDVAAMILAALSLPRSCEVTDVMMRPMRPG